MFTVNEHEILIYTSELNRQAGYAVSNFQTCTFFDQQNIALADQQNVALPF